MNGRLKENIVSLLLQQASNEKYNSNFYATLANNMAVVGFNKSAQFFLKQHEEETEHFLKIWNYLMEKNSLVIMPEVKAITDEKYDDIVESFNAALQLEYRTSEEWGNILDESLNEKDWDTKRLSEEFILIQHNEETEFMSYCDELKLIGNNFALLKLWDSQQEF
jgi:ferritin